MRKFTLKPGGPPPGTYRARLGSVRDTMHLEFGAGMRFEFEIIEGAQTGDKVSRITGILPTPANAAGRMLSGLAGKLALHEEVDISDFVGREYLIVVEEVREGVTRVASVSPAHAD